VAPGEGLEQLHGPWVTKGKPEYLTEAVDTRAHHALHHWEAPKEFALQPRKRPVMTAYNPRSRSLKDMQLFNLRLDRRHELYRGRASTDHRNPTMLNLELVIPARGVKHFALESFQPG